jgi:6-phosphofructokinase 1
MRIGILTGGGDVPGLNSCIRTLVYRAQDEGHEVLGIRRGWAGLLHFNPDDPLTQDEYILPLDKKTTRTVDRSGGTFLHTSRTNPASVKPKDVPGFLRDSNFDENAEGRLDYTPHVITVLEHLGVEVLVAIGGDDTLGYGARLYEDNIPIIAIPKTMDNDVFGTDYCIGFSTAVTRSVKFIHQLRTTSGSHERLAVIELFGRNCGETCLISAYLAYTDRAIISEVPFDPEKLAHLMMEDQQRNPSRYAMVAISEGARFIEGSIVESGQEDAFGHKKLGGIGLLTSDFIKRITGANTLYQQLAYLMRTGAPDSLDLMVAANFANLAMDLISKSKYGRMVAIQGGCYTHVPANTVNQGIRRVDVQEMYDVENYRPRMRAVESKPMFLY